ncbi:MAG: transglutaminase domain-containing protein [Lentisphaeria bacterium]|nr:transglutaminase domain-containing protein [Lentisphaeria bacterium]
MRSPKPEPEYIRDTSRMRRTPPHGSAHWLFALLLMVSVAGALWQHGQMELTLGLLAAIPLFAATVYIPYRWVNSLVRLMVKGLLFGGAIAWCCWRMKSSYADLVLMEGVSIASLIFISGGKPKDYFDLFFISLFLLIYGALIPRLAHLNLTVAAAVLLMLIAFFFRSEILCGRTARREKPFRPLRSVHPAVIQLILSGVFFCYVFALMPKKENDVPGVFETSFLTTRDQALPPELQEWLKPKKVTVSEQGKRIFEPPAAPPPEVKPSVVAEKGTPVKLPEAVSKSIIDGEGGGSQGQDLVFYVKSPVKLYHLARLYDVYDGAQWKASERLNKIQIRDYPSDSGVRAHYVEQKYTLVKLLSKRLYSGFMPSSFMEQHGDSPVLTTQSPLFKTTFYGGELLRQPQQHPFLYQTSVQLPMPLGSLDEARASSAPPEPHASATRNGRNGKPGTARDPAWIEKNINRNHYLLLPPKKISPRVRHLAGEITAGLTTPYARALALRDYLRQNYRYKLEAEKVPPGREPADYFLFELKEGHCEYFACALAVLARAAGLPARVAVGFSPGNYNTLSNMFEVYEYHAHAWTQIYIARLGWLTMDATPPSVLQSHTLPAGIGQLRDPFGDEWKITPPELTENTQTFLKNDLMENMKKGSQLSKVDSTLVEMVKTQEMIQADMEKRYQQTVKKIQESREKGMLFKLKNLWDRTADFFRNAVRSLYDLLFSAWLSLLAGILLVVAGVIFLRMALIRWKCRRRVRTIARLRTEAGSLCENDPRQAVRNIYTAFRFALELAGYERGARELIDFADSLARESRPLGEAARMIFLQYYRVEYGTVPPTAEAARETIRLFDSVRPVIEGQ